MNIVQISAGTGNYHCDTCLRDLGMVRAMRAAGHDVVLVPLYLPLVSEQADGLADETPLFLGGINAYLQQKLSLFRHTPHWVDRVFDAQWLLKTAAGYADMTQPADLGEMTLSTLRGLEGNQRKEIVKCIEWLQTHTEPDVICLSNALLMGFVKPLREALGVPVFCTLQGSDFFIDNLTDPWRDQAWQLLREVVDDCAGLIAVSHFYGGLMQERLAIPDDKLFVVLNGVDLTAFLEDPEPPAVPTLGFLSQMTPLRGLDLVVEAFLALKTNGSLPALKLRVGGSMVPAWRKFVDQQKRRLAAFAEDVSFEVVLDRPAKAAFLRGLSVFSVPVRYPEPFGLAGLEAMAAGIPVVEPISGAYPELVAATDGGCCVDMDEPGAYQAALLELLGNPEHARRIGQRARRKVQQLYSADRMAHELVAVFDRALARA